MKDWLCLTMVFAAACSSSGPWRRVETPHFTLRTDLGSGEAKRAAVALEATRDALVSAAWPHAKFGEGKTAVYVIANDLDFERSFGRQVGGLFLQSSTTGAQFYLPGAASRWELRRSANLPTRSVLRHELAHQLSHQVWPRQPRWFAEGLADFLESIYYSEDQSNIVLGGVNFKSYGWYRGVRTTRVEDALHWPEGEVTDTEMGGLGPAPRPRTSRRNKQPRRPSPGS